MSKSVKLLQIFCKIVIFIWWYLDDVRRSRRTQLSQSLICKWVGRQIWFGKELAGCGYMRKDQPRIGANLSPSGSQNRICFAPRVDSRRFAVVYFLYPETTLHVPHRITGKITMKRSSRNGHNKMVKSTLLHGEWSPKWEIASVAMNKTLFKLKII